MDNLPWFANKGQIIQVISALASLIAIIVGIKFKVPIKATIIKWWRPIANLFAPCRNPRHQEFDAVYEDDVKHVSNRAVICEVILLAQSQHGDPHPYLTFRFTVVNAAVFPIMFSDQVRGSVQCLNSTLPAPTMTQGHNGLLLHGNGTFIVLQQFFAQAFAQRINQSRSIDVDFSGVKVPILKDGKQYGSVILGKYTFSNIAQL